MKFIPTPIPEIIVVEPDVFGDSRGFFLESWHAKKFAENGINARFVQDNHSRSRQGILRGLHYQINNPQGKLVHVVNGKVQPPSGNGSVSISVVRIKRCSGFLQGSPMDFMLPARWPISYTNAPTFMLRNTRGPLPGMIQTWPLTGRLLTAGPQPFQLKTRMQPASKLLSIMIEMKQPCIKH